MKHIGLILFFGTFGITIPMTAQVEPGIDVLIERQFDILQNKRVGLITNPTGVTSSLKSTIDVLHEAQNVQLTALFGPEHGVRGNIYAGKKVGHFTDDKTGSIVYSLYGNHRKPSPEMLHDVDILVYDIQDAGYRAYTYIYTMAYAMQAAAENGIPFAVLDRPSPFSADLVDGPILEKKYASFIGLYPIPYIYGMTAGELAQFFNSEYGFGTELTVVPMRGYHREMHFSETGLEWVATSPHIPHAKTALLAATLGVIGELHTISVGIGYTQPFEMVGQTWVDPHKLAQDLNRRELPGVIFRPCHFRPYYTAMKDTELGGVQIHIVDERAFEPLRTQLHIMHALIHLFPNHNIFDATPARMRSFLKAMGTDRVHKALLAGRSPDEIRALWKDDIAAFKRKRKKYLIY